MTRTIQLPPSHPALDTDTLDITRRVATELHSTGFKLVFPETWQGIPHFHARIPGTTNWTHIYIRPETDDRFLKRFNRDVSGQSRKAGKFA